MQAAENAGNAITRTRYCELMQQALHSYTDYKQLAIRKTGKPVMSRGGTKPDTQLALDVDKAVPKFKSLCPADHRAFESRRAAISGLEWWRTAISAPTHSAEDQSKIATMSNSLAQKRVSIISIYRSCSPRPSSVNVCLIYDGITNFPAIDIGWHVVMASELSEYVYNCNHDWLRS